MIVPMNKLTLLCLAEYKDETLKELRDLGAVHISHVTAPRSHNLDKSQSSLKAAKSMQVILDSYKKQSSSADDGPMHADKATIIQKASDLIQKEKQLTSEIDHLNKEKQRIEPFGSFDPVALDELSQKGLIVKLFRVPRKATPAAPEDTHLFTIAENSEEAHIAIVGKQEFEFDGQAFPLPERPLSEVISRIEAAEAELLSTKAQLGSLSQKQDMVEDVISELEADIELTKAKEGMGDSGAIAYIQGFCPKDLTDSVLASAKKHGWGTIIDEPAGDERVPTLIKSPTWVKPIQGLFTMLDILPGYKEVDIRSVFFIFFGLFFAMLVSDAGYGFVFLAAAIILKAVFKKAPAGPFILAGVLSICAITWGVLTGSYFGIEHLPPILNEATIGWFKSEENIMLFSFFIGAIHLSIAHAWRAILTINSTRALGQLGWIVVTWAAFFLTRFLILGHELPFCFKPMVWIGIGLVAVFMTPFKLLKKEWADHVMLPFDLVGGFADLVSYVRLFAVGSASLAVAEAFNELAIGNGVESIFAGIWAGIILLLGHSLNIILALMSILVHGVRLNTLEFSGHIGLEWSGFKYEPLANRLSSKKES